MFWFNPCSGKIDMEAIVTTFRISDVIYYENRIPRLSQLLRLDVFRAAPAARILSFRLSESPGEANWRSGFALGLLLRNIGFPKEHWEDFAANFAESWLLRGWRGRKLNERYQEYLKGVFHTDGQDIPQDMEDDVIMTKDGDERRVSAFNNIIMAEPDAQADNLNADQVQALINAQLHAELAKSLLNHTTHEANPQSTNAAHIPRRPNPYHTTTDPEHEPPTPARPTTRFTRPRSSSLFSFSRPIPLPGPPTNWEASNSRDVSPAPTDRSALDTFTAELLAKAEEVSTMGSFGRGASTVRGGSEVWSVGREGDGGGEVGRVGEGVQEGFAVVGLLSDDDDLVGDAFSVIDLSAEDGDGAADDESVEDLGLEILGSRNVRD
jgi:hypothetical protein